MKIRPVSDLRNHYKDIESEVLSSGPVFLTKNGYGSMVVMSIDQFERINGTTEAALTAADQEAASTQKRYSHTEVFNTLHKELNDHVLAS